MPENPYKNLPPFLYKYRYFDDDGYHLQLLTDGKLYCSSPMNFNDPFDCVVRIDYSSPTDNDILQKYIRLEKYQYPNLEHSKIVEIAKEKASTIDKKPLEDSELMKSRILDHISNYIGIFSLSGEESNILLWSHYSDSHKGFLVEFNALYLKNFLVNTYLPLNQKHLLFDVGYSNTYKLKWGI